MLGSNMQMVTLALNPPQRIVVMTTHFYQESDIYKYVFCSWEIAGGWYTGMVVSGIHNDIEIVRIMSLVCQTVSNLNDLMPHFSHIN